MNFAQEPLVDAFLVLRLLLANLAPLLVLAVLVLGLLLRQ